MCQLIHKREIRQREHMQHLFYKQTSDIVLFLQRDISVYMKKKKKKKQELGMSKIVLQWLKVK